MGRRKPGQERLDRGSVLPNTGGRCRRVPKPDELQPIGSLVLPNTGGRRAPKPDELQPIGSLVLPNTGGRRATRSWRAGLQQVQAGRFGEGFLAAMGVQFAVEAADLRLDGVG